MTLYELRGGPLDGMLVELDGGVYGFVTDLGDQPQPGGYIPCRCTNTCTCGCSTAPPHCYWDPLAVADPDGIGDPARQVWP